MNPGGGRAYSNLAGSWWISLGDFYASMKSKGYPGDTSIPPSWKNRHILLFKIEDDGHFDWSRTECGVTEGFRNLAMKGDRRKGLRYPYGDFEVLSAKYRPTRSQVTIRRAWDDGVSYPWDTLTLTARLKSDGSAVFTQTVAGRDSGSITNGVQLRCHRGLSDFKSETRSSIAGCWALDGADEKIVLVIRPNGTFDWTGTVEGMLGGMYQLEIPGNKSFNRMDGTLYDVVSSCYSAEESQITLQASREDDKGALREVVRFQFHATKLDSEHIDFEFSANEGSEKEHRGKATLHRVENVSGRAESAMIAFAAPENEVRTKTETIKK